MKNALKQIIPFELSKYSSNKKYRQLYVEWDKPSRQVQISVITFLTAFLYIGFIFINKPWMPEEVKPLVIKLHLLIIVPMLLSLSFLAYKKRFYQVLMPCLALFPVISLSVHVYICTLLDDNTIFLTEGYLGIVWIFIISGMTLRYALVSATITSTILITAGYYILTKPGDYAMHVYWIFCSYSFGLIGAFIFDQSRWGIFSSQHKLQKLAVTDSLTGIYNRSKFNQIITEKFSQDSQNESQFGLIIIDIDHFKRINDSHGHEVGDQVIRKVAKVLSETIAKNDTIVRWGGEEFVVIVTSSDSQSLSVQCERLRKSINEAKFPLGISVTISLGGTLYKEKDSKDLLLIRADNALYQAKEQGRNCYVLSV